MYQKQWIPKQNFVWDDLLVEQVDILMKQWSQTNEYSKRINTQTMHDESSYKHLQNIKSKIKQKIKNSKKNKKKRKKNNTGICYNNALGNFIKTLYKDDKNSDAVWGNCIDGHYQCYGTSCVESMNLFQQSKSLMIKHDLEHCIIVLRLKTIKRALVSLNKRFGYHKLSKGNSTGISCLALVQARAAYIFLYFFNKYIIFLSVKKIKKRIKKLKYFTR